ncbi:MAG: aminotransferase class III-fold pyridoxal phosphate-dependent enzyme, partial [Kordiimonas sp.]
AFIAESIAGVGGQIVYPDGFLKHAYSAVREAGALCIADEVQVGFGRVGTHMWAFEQQGVVPDIVTLGKPIGNGHPMAAVVTTKEIADAFANGMEYFNSFGGNPVSCAVGMAVLDVIENESLQEKALKTGTYLLEGLKELQKQYSVIGDVRGTGLFVGIELVQDNETLVPATEEANWIVQFCRDEGVLLSTDGPFENVIKMKPPMVFGIEEADQLLSVLAKAFAQLITR